MAYSQKSFRLARRSAFVILFGGLATLILLLKRHYIDPTLYVCLVGVLALVAGWLLLYSHRYRDEIQRQAAEKRTYWGSQIGIAASTLVALVLMMPNTTWLDSLMQFMAKNHAVPHLYFIAGFMLPVLFQAVATLSLRLSTKLRSGGQA